MRTLAHLSEAELLARALSPWARRLRTVSTGLWLALTVGLPWFVLRNQRFGADWLCLVPSLVFVGWLSSAGLMVVLMRAFGGYAHRVELLRRAGWVPFVELIEQPLTTPWRIVLEVVALPHGGRRQIVLEGGPEWTLTATSLHSSDLVLEVGDPRELLQRVKAPVDPAAACAVLAGLPEGRPLSGEGRAPVIDGLPFTLHVTHGTWHQRVSGNLRAGFVDPRTEALVHGLGAFARDAGLEALLSGSTDARGVITIAEE